MGMTAATKTRRRLTGPMSQRLRTAREDAGLTQQQIATTIGSALKTVNNYENPAYRGARKRYVVKEWAEVCDRRFEELWGTRHQPFDPTGWLSRFPARAACLV